ncbi:hypothetical protein SPI_04357 [Niveomyces insectorum RCEF 264]|uniref:DUF1772 domain containing protein n=1 Tax=Niveomyces insectorum RCEF 264 TaxID=1081102 RepID=A0A167VNI6_9HYPO|nr:hypothetical protein SPI_04357 [Niveomyces insectorum RCEF 264]
MATFDVTSASNTFRAAQATGLFVSAAAAGAGLGLSVFTVPRLLEAPPDLMLRQWKRTFDRGKPVFIASGVVSALSYGYVYYAAQRSLASSHVLVASRLPLLAAGLSLAVMPYTLLFVLPTNKKLEARVAQVAEAEEKRTAGGSAGTKTFTAEEEESAKQLVDRWGLLNLGRPLLMAAAAFVGLASFL